MKNIITCLLILLSASCFGQVPDPQPNTYINDMTGKLNMAEIQMLNESILSIEKNSSVQIAIVLLDKLPVGMSIGDYALEIGRKWHVGNARNGLVYVAAFGDKKQRLEVADNLQHQITDLDALALTDEIKPFFRSGDYFGGLNNLLSGISKKLDPILAEQKSLTKAELDKKSENSSSYLATILSFIVLSFSVLLYVIFRNKKRIKEEDDLWEKNLLKIRSTIKNERDSQVVYKNKQEPYKPERVPPVTYVPIPEVPYIPPVSSPSKSDYGNWGQDSSNSDSSTFDSGFSGGGATNDL